MHKVMINSCLLNRVNLGLNKHQCEHILGTEVPLLWSLTLENSKMNVVYEISNQKYNVWSEP